MRFLGSLAIFLATAQAAVTADGLITTFNAFQDAATELQDDARKVNAENCASFTRGQGPLNVRMLHSSSTICIPCAVLANPSCLFARSA